MILSMTGYGQSSKQILSKNYRIEIKSLNGKTTDIRFKTNIYLKDKELELRKLINEKALRGKIEVNLIVDSESGSEEYFINKNLLSFYYQEMKDFAQSSGLAEGDMLPALIRLPNVVQIAEIDLSQEEWQEIKLMSEEALDNLMEFRKNEGDILKEDILSKVESIVVLLSQVQAFEEERIDKLRERIKKNLGQYMSKENVDENRFEQEILFYMEKLDINEEKVRLAQHCKYFKEEVLKDHRQKGKKLSFIAQEIGREINTLGSKAQHPDIQQIVVQMKDELEKIKEQVLNIL